MRLSGGFLLPVILMVSVSGLKLCSENCKAIRNLGLSTCNRDTGDCLEGCKPGFYGDTCSMTCDVNCKRGCQRRDGYCTCSLGYLFSNGSCVSFKGVECISNDHCLYNTCLSQNRDDCLQGCKSGWHGRFCNQRCSAHCFCNKQSGQCNSCIPGRYGEDCGLLCSPGCKDEKCDSEGICVHGCTSGNYGKRCEQNCSHYCVSGCDRLSGECSQCEAGRYGSTCQSRCSAGCAGTNKNCDRNGTCIRGCSNGYSGGKCESTCPVQCYEDRCDIEGTCTTCKPGFYGTFCRKTCKLCTDGLCDKITGKCIKGCVSGFFGKRCAKNCWNCTDRVCDSATGECTNGCQRGYHGYLCNMVCEDCEGGDCNRNTGECTVPGKWISFAVGGGVLSIFIVLAVFMACCMKRMRDVMQDGVYLIGQNTAMHGTQLRSVELGNAEHNGSVANTDDTYNHLFDIKPLEATFSLADDDLETSSGYCAVRPLYHDLPHQLSYEIDDRYSIGSYDGALRSSLCEGNCNDRQEMKMDEAPVVVEKDQISDPIKKINLPSKEKTVNTEPIQILALQPAEVFNKETIQKSTFISDKGQCISEAIEIVTLCPDKEVIPNEFQDVALPSDTEGACGSIIKDDEDENKGRGRAKDGCPSLDPDKQETEGDDPVVVKEDESTKFTGKTK